MRALASTASRGRSAPGGKGDASRCGPDAGQRTGAEVSVAGGNAVAAGSSLQGCGQQGIAIAAVWAAARDGAVAAVGWQQECPPAASARPAEATTTNRARATRQRIPRDYTPSQRRRMHLLESG